MQHNLLVLAFTEAVAYGNDENEVSPLQIYMEFDSSFNSS